MVRVLIKCPECSALDRIEVDESIIAHNERGVTAVNVIKSTMCSHSFVVYIDTNFAVRDSFVTDFNVELPQIKVDDPRKMTLKRDFDQYIIFLNMKPLTVSYILRCCFLKKNIIFINNMNIINPHLIGFLKYLFLDTFEYEITILSKDEYKKNKKKYKKYIVFSDKKIIRDKLEILKEKQMKIERTMIQNYLKGLDSESSLIILRNEIYKVFKILENIIDYSIDKNLIINPKVIVDRIIEKFSVNISKAYLNFLILILKEYFKKEISDSLNVNEFVDFI